jgi:MATE family multidrug resistance protein
MDGMQVVEEMKRMGSIAGPMVWLGLLLYGRMVTSMYYLGRLGELELAGGSLAIGLANITCYSVLSGLALGMEPICGQAYGARRWAVMGLALQRTILVLLCVCVPIAALWLHVGPLLRWLGQDPRLAGVAAAYLRYSLPGLAAQAVLNPLRVYLRAQSLTAPLTTCTSAALVLHVALNHALVRGMGLGIRGVALAAAATDFNHVFLLLLYLRYFSSSSSSSASSACSSSRTTSLPSSASWALCRLHARLRRTADSGGGSCTASGAGRLLQGYCC